MNYSELVQAIKDYTEYEETSFVSNIPTFVRQAEEKIHRTVTIPELRKNVTGRLTSGNRYLQRPTDFLAVFSLAVVDGSGDYSYLYDKDVNFIREAYPGSTTGLPRFYGQFDGDDNLDYGNFILGPTPDASYTVELHYYYDPESIVTASTSWLGENAETALLNGSLVEAYTYMKGDPDIMQLYRQQYDDAMQALFKVGTMSQRDEYKDGRLG